MDEQDGKAFGNQMKQKGRDMIWIISQNINGIPEHLIYYTTLQ
jgi:hypothetical protein